MSGTLVRRAPRLDALVQAAKASAPVLHVTQLQRLADNRPVIQREIAIAGDGRSFRAYGSKNTNDLVEEIKQSGTVLKRGWIKEVRELAKDRNQHDFKSKGKLIKKLVRLYPPGKKGGPYDRPTFSNRAYFLARVVTSLAWETNVLHVGLKDNDLALPHRMSFRDIRESTRAFADGNDSAKDLKRWTQRLIDATVERMNISTGRFNDLKATLRATKQKSDMTEVLKQKDKYLGDAQTSINNAIKGRTKLIDAVTHGKGDTTAAIKSFLAAFNEIHGNIPDIGQHKAVNIVVSSAAHLNSEETRGRSKTRTDRPGKRALTPGSRAATDMSPTRLGDGIAFDSSGKFPVGTGGGLYKISEFGKESQKRLKRHPEKLTNVTKKRIQQDSKKRKRGGWLDPAKYHEVRKKPRGDDSDDL